MSRSEEFDVVIVGGGVMGCSTAYHLLWLERGLRLAVVERDPTYARASSALSVGNARVQFSLEQNIEISRYTFGFLDRFGEEMAVDDLPPEAAFRAEGNLFMIDRPGRQLAENSLALQQRLGCSVEWLSPEEIEHRYPLYRCAGYEGATLGVGDGHLDGYAFLMGFKNKARSLGAEFVDDEAVRIVSGAERVSGVDLASGIRLSAPVVVNCAGAWAAGLAATANVRLPVRPVQRQVFVMEPAVKPAGPLPLTNLPSGLYFRSEGESRILVGKSLDEDRQGFDLKWEESRFNEVLWPELAEFVPAFEALRLERGWAGLYAVNTLDGNAILGEWPELRGLYLANGFSGHGLQQAPAVGRYLAELIVELKPVLDLAIFGPERILTGDALDERALV